jgi:hypothetical protein
MEKKRSWENRKGKEISETGNDLNNVTFFNATASGHFVK